jgi:hypothetical protein
MQSFDFQVVINCPLKLAFAVYTDIEHWRNRSIFGDIRWVKGSPWEEGSRLRVETVQPIRSTVDQVVLHCTPNRNVSYLSHVFGITTETRVNFTAVSDRQTTVLVAMQLVGRVSQALGFAIEPMILKTTKQVFEDLRKECEAAAKEGSDRP